MIFGNKERILYGNRFNGTNGNGYQPIKREQTNEEWLRQANTEQLAEWVAKQCGNAVMESTYDVSKLRKKRYWVEWLKQPHTEKE